MEDTFMLKERHQRKEAPRMTTEVGTSWQSVEYRRASRCEKASGGIIQAIWTMCWDKL